MSFAEFFTGRKHLNAKHLLIIAALALAITVTVVLFGGFFAYVAYQQIFNAPRAEQIRKDLEYEWGKIVPLPSAEVQTTFSATKPQVVGISTDYRTDLGYEEIRRYYDAELARHGWKFAAEEDAPYNWQNYGAKQAFYCKGEYTADLYYAGELEKKFGWRYAFSLSWGTYDYCR